MQDNQIEETGDRAEDSSSLISAAPKPPIKETDDGTLSKMADLPVAPKSGIIGDDIAKILQEVKLPERRNVKGAADVTPKARIPVVSIELDQTHASESAVPNQASEKRKDGEHVNETSIVMPLRTLKDDLQGIVKEQHISLVRAASLEEEKRSRKPVRAQTEEHQRSVRRTKNTLGLVFAVLMLVALGSSALFGVYYIANQQMDTSVAVPDSSILFAERTVSLPINAMSASDLKLVLAAALTSTGGSLGSITRIVPTVTSTSTEGVASTRAASLTEFLKSLGARAPDEFLRATGPSFFLGIHTIDSNVPVLIIPVTSYSHAFAGMLAWEPLLNEDFAPVFKAVPMLKTDANNLPVERVFEDDIMRNYDVRELKDDSGQIRLFYSFPTPNILVIAESPYTFTEVLNRLQAARKL